MPEEGTGPDETVRRLAALSTSDLSDVTAGAGVLAPGLHRVSGSGTIAGRAVTAESEEGSLFAIFSALDASSPGDVLCMTAPGGTAYLGDLAAHDIANRGIAAVIVDGFVRDTAVLAQLPVAFFARGRTPVARRGPGAGRSMVPIELGDVAVAPGDWLVADDDGVIVLADSEVEDVLAQAEAAKAVEERMLARIKGGETLPQALKAELGIDVPGVAAS